jgi:phosphoglucosamine mutase
LDKSKSKSRKSSTKGKVILDNTCKNRYYQYLKDVFDSLDTQYSLLIDVANGVHYDVSNRVLKSVISDYHVVHNSKDRVSINDNCGALDLESIQNEVIKQKADFGFAYDGDSDRVISISDKGDIISGDILLYIIATYFKDNGKLNDPTIVGTKHTNMGIEKELNCQGIKLIRTDIGDKYVSEQLIKNNLLIGGEQSGHIIVRNYLSTGDGILNSLLLCYIFNKTNKQLSDFDNLKLFKQSNLNIPVKNKEKIFNNVLLKQLLTKKEQELKNIGRIMLRMSGTEP